MPYVIPTPNGKFKDFQRRVQEAGYPWISTVYLQPYGTGYQGHPDHLGEHRHHSHNTHLIIEGQLTLRFPRRRYETSTIDAHSRDMNQKEKKVAPNISYTGTAGPNGATFIEAHSVLSPDTADRFRDRGDLVWQYDGSGETPETWRQAYEQRLMFRQVDQGRRGRDVNTQRLYRRFSY